MQTNKHYLTCTLHLVYFRTRRMNIPPLWALTSKKFTSWLFDWCDSFRKFRGLFHPPLDSFWIQPPLCLAKWPCIFDLLIEHWARVIPRCWLWSFDASLWREVLRRGLAIRWSLFLCRGQSRTWRVRHLGWLNTWSVNAFVWTWFCKRWGMCINNTASDVSRPHPDVIVGCKMYESDVMMWKSLSF